MKKSHILALFTVLFLLALAPAGAVLSALANAENFFVGDDCECLRLPDEALGDFDHAKFEPSGK